jgi:hypothetical protein
LAKKREKKNKKKKQQKKKGNISLPDNSPHARAVQKYFTTPSCIDKG